MNEFLVKLQDAVNAVPCKYCGKMHSVSLKASGTELRPVITYGFSEDACDEFKYAVEAYVSHMLSNAGYPVTAL